MQKLWIFHSSNELYGSDRVLLEIVKGLDKKEWNVRVILPDDLDYQPVLSQKLAELGVEVESRPLAVLRRRYQNPSGLLKLAWRLGRTVPKLALEMRKQRVKLVYTNTGVVLSGALAAKLAGAKHIWGLKEHLPDGKIGAILARLYTWFSIQISVTSEAVQRNLIKSYPPANPKIVVINNSVDTARFQPDPTARHQIRVELGLDENAVVAAMIGRVSQTKGPEVFLAAAQLLQSQFPLARFLIVGGPIAGEEAYLESLEQKAQTLGLSEIVLFLDFRADIAPLLKALDMVVVPSLRPEGFGLTAIEGMASGCAIVAAAHGGPLETIEEGVNGFLYSPPTDPTALANSLAKLFADPALRQKMGQHGRETALTRFSREREVNAYRHLFENCNNSPRRHLSP